MYYKVYFSFSETQIGMKKLKSKYLLFVCPFMGC